MLRGRHAFNEICVNGTGCMFEIDTVCKRLMLSWLVLYTFPRCTRFISCELRQHTNNLSDSLCAYVFTQCSLKLADICIESFSLTTFWQMSIWSQSSVTVHVVRGPGTVNKIFVTHSHMHSESKGRASITFLCTPTTSLLDFVRRHIRFHQSVRWNRSQVGVLLFEREMSALHKWRLKLSGDTVAWCGHNSQASL